MGKDTVLPFFALLVLLIGSVSSLYVYASQTNTETITVHGQPFTIEQINTLVKPRVFPTLNYSGVALDDLIVKAGVVHPEDHSYILTGADGYQKTVTWENMKNGLLTQDRQSVFSDLPKAFRIKDVTNIEVK
jgi:hypothetical protein